MSVFVHYRLSACVAVDDDVPAEGDAPLHRLRPADERIVVLGVSTLVDEAQHHSHKVLRELVDV